jgi:endonuclease I/chitodextrinase
MKKTLLLLSLFFNLLVNAQGQLTPPTDLQSYYNNVDFSPTGTPLFNDLATETIAKHINILQYGERHNYLYNADEDLANNANVILMYNSESTDKREYLSGGNSYSPQTFNTEHVYPQSLIVNNAKGDLHHLRTCDITINGNRGNKPFTDSSGNYGIVGSAWYPGDEWKGDVARMIMYLNLRYDESFTDVGTLNLFLEWNVEDPVSDFEKQRNEVIATAQGNRNPFIDNPFIATVIWGGTAAQNTWGASDTEAPTAPSNIVLNNITTSTIDATWSASSDNEAVAKYEVYANGTINGETTTTNYKVTGLNSNTVYAITVLAKDIANNKSDQSTAVNGTTLTDNEAPTVPINISISNQTGTSFRVNWNASTDDSAVTAYEVFIDGTLNGSTANTNYDVTGLSISTTYSVNVLAKDSANNMSAQSTTVNGTTSDGISDVSELFFSEYVEGNSFNKALEIVNLTSNNVDLSPYTVKRQSNAVWETPLQLIGTIAINDVFVIINSSATNATLLQEKDQEVANSTPMTFNGDDRIGLFKNDVLIDIIGDLDGTNTFAENVTLRRNTDVKGPNTTYSEQAEWSDFFSNTLIYTDIGNFNGTLSLLDNSILNALKIYPNPTNGDHFNIRTTEHTTITIYNVLGKIVKIAQITEAKNNVDISDLSKGVFIIKMSTANKSATTKLIKN